jgi:catechol 2,3-dioxygenase-like lactoylglutathione lyase family enzyme
MFRQTLLTFFISTALSAHPLVTAVESIGMTVSNLDRSVDFYTKVLSFEKVNEHEDQGEAAEHLMGVFGLHTRTARLKLGDEFLELTEYFTPKGRAIPDDSRSNDRWFQHVAIIVSDMDRAYRWLRENQVTYSSPSPQRLPEWNKNAAGIQAFYFKDPEQERLNNVFGAHLRITALRAASGPGIEFLEYLAPSDGRPYPSSKPNDLLHWHTRFSGTSADDAAQALRKFGSAFLSNGVVRKSFLARDPDGHAVEFVEP